MKHLRILALAATAILAGATMASAQEAFTTNDVNMRAGPGNRFPAVALIPEDSNVYIHGCLSNWDWCDVSWGRRARGWVFSDYLEAFYHHRRLGFDEYRSYVDIPFVSFGFGYWDRYYRDRPWFDQWDRWGGNGNWRDRNHNNGGDWNNNDNNNGDWNRTGDHNNGGDWNRTGNDNGDQADDNSADNNNNDRVVRRDRRNGNGPDMNGPGMRCGTENASPDCPPTSHGRQMQQYQQ